MDLAKLIDDVIASQPEDEPRKYIGASAIGHECSRSIWYSYKRYKGAPFPAKTRKTFAIGNTLESLILKWITKGGIEIRYPYHEPSAEMQYFTGNVDALLSIDDELIVLEIKTANKSNFANFKMNGLQKWNEQYYAQIQAYMGMLKLNKGILLAINKDTSDLHSETVIFDPMYYANLCYKAKSIHEAQEPPMRINDNPCYFVCQMCKFKTLCHGL